MTEILIDVDLGHPPGLVWSALTDRRLLSAWFMRTELEPRPGSRFRLVPDGPLGLAGWVDGEVVEVGERRMVMLWRGEQMHARVTWELTAISGGCRLRMRQTGFVGSRGGLRRRQLSSTYDRLFRHRLPDLLDRLAGGWEDLDDLAAWHLGGGAAPDPPAAFSPIEPASGVDGPGAADAGRGADDGAGHGPDRDGARRGWIARLPHLPPHRRGQLLAVAGTLALAVFTASVLSAIPGDNPIQPGLAEPAISEPDLGLLPEPSPAPAFTPTVRGAPAGPTGSAAATGGAAAGAPPGAASAGGTGRGASSGGGSDTGGGDTGGDPDPQLGGDPGPGPSGDPDPGSGGDPGGRPGAANWSADYQTTKVVGNGFHGTLAIRNTGTAGDADWRVTLTLADGARITSAKGAAWTQGGREATLTSADGATIGAGEGLTVEVKVHDKSDTGRPVACSINGTGCG